MEKNSTNVDTKDDTFTVKTTEKNCIGFCFKQKSSKIEIYLPENYKGDINIKNSYGDIIIDKFLDVNIDIENDYGDIEVNN